MVEHALQYAARGWAVLPLHEALPDGCTCGKDCPTKHRGKHPRLFNGVHGASSDTSEIRRWFRRWPTANIGVACGAVSGVWVLDVDVDDDGIASLTALENEHSRLPDTMITRTGSGGGHLWFVYPEAGVRKNRVRFRPGLDLRTDGGYVVAAPSVHRSGRRYEWVGDDWLAPAPAWLLAIVSPPPPPASPPRRQFVATLSPDEARRAAASRLAKDPDARERAAIHLGGSVSGDADKRRAFGVACPRCRRPSVWWPIAPIGKGAAACSHKNSCGWWGWLEELLNA